MGKTSDLDLTVVIDDFSVKHEKLLSAIMSTMMKYQKRITKFDVEKQRNVTFDQFKMGPRMP